MFFSTCSFGRIPVQRKGNRIFCKNSDVQRMVEEARVREGKREKIFSLCLCLSLFQPKQKLILARVI